MTGCSLQIIDICGRPFDQFYRLFESVIHTTSPRGVPYLCHFASLASAMFGFSCTPNYRHEYCRKFRLDKILTISAYFLHFAEVTHPEIKSRRAVLSPYYPRYHEVCSKWLRYHGQSSRPNSDRQFCWSPVTSREPVGKRKTAFPCQNWFKSPIQKWTLNHPRSQNWAATS